MTDSLVDIEGFPRADLDIYLVRQTRVQIIKLSNDHKFLLKQIEECLVKIHSTSAKDSNVSTTVAGQRTFVSLNPFAKIDGVAPDSPAFEAGLQRGDAIVEFGSLNEKTVVELSDLNGVVKAHENVHPLLFQVLQIIRHTR